MVVALDVMNIDNMLLVPAGCPLTERHIDILKAWGVTEVEVDLANDVADMRDPLSQLPPEKVAQITAEMRKRFWALDEANPAAMKVFEVMLQRKARRCLSL